MKKILKTGLLYLFIICFGGNVLIQSSALPVSAASKVSVRLNYSSLILVKGKSFNLKATVRGTSRKPAWKSSNSSVAAVSRNGRVVARNYGTATISATVNGKTARCRHQMVLYAKRKQERCTGTDHPEQRRRRCDLYCLYCPGKPCCKSRILQRQRNQFSKALFLLCFQIQMFVRRGMDQSHRRLLGKSLRNVRL